MAEEQDEFLDQSDLNQNVSGAETDEIPQKRNDTLLFWKTRPKKKTRE